MAYIEATAADIAAAYALAHAVLGSTLDELPPQTRRLLGLVRAMVEARALAEGIKAGEVRFLRREVREATGWSDTQLKVHLGRLAELEYLLVRRAQDGHHGGRFVYELIYDGQGQDGAPFLMGLIDIDGLSPEQPAKERSYDQNRSGVEEDRPGHGRPPVGGWPGGEHPLQPNACNGSEAPHVPDLENARLERNGAPVVAAAAFG